MASPAQISLGATYENIAKRMVATPKLLRRTVLVTGASRGIGLAIALAFGLQRAKKMFLVGREEASLSDAAELISKSIQSWQSIEIKIGDVKQRDFWTGLRREQVFEKLDVLVNAAGVAHSSLLIASKAEVLENVVQINLMGTMWGCQIASKAMVGQKRDMQNPGCIINVASLLATQGGGGATAYAASKAGVLGLTRSLANELGPSNIRVNAIVPGYIKTAMTTAMSPAARELVLKRIPQRRYGTTLEVADAAVFLAANQYANNCVLNLDGGLSAM